ncbi:MAG: hypothetical protein Q8O03_08290 [Nanoarchaeota archaeon]|nr:hypothetical protein [Nanoarchaeota archaeon]
MLRINRLLKRELSKEKILSKDVLEVSTPLSSLMGLKLQGEKYQGFMNQIYRLIEAENPSRTVKACVKEKDYLEALLAIEELPSITSLEDIENLTLSQAKDKAVKDFDQKFDQLRKSYNSLKQEKAKALINKSLHFILASKNVPELEGFVKLAEELPIPKNSDLIFYNNWFLMGEKFKQKLNSNIECIEQKLEGTEKDMQLRELKEELAEKSKHYITELRNIIEIPEIQKLITITGLEDSSLRIANNLVIYGSLILPKLRKVTEHTGKDLDDLIRYQFPDKDLYCIEEASNSKDAQAKNVNYKFFSNGLIIEDDGHGMARNMFCEEYPFPYLSVKKGELNIGRFGAGSKAKLIEVLKHEGEVFVESKSDDTTAVMQRYFLHDSTLYLGFSKSEKAKTGTKVTMISPDRTKEDKANQKKLMTERLSHFDPNKILVRMGIKTINKNSLLRKPEIETIAYNGEKNRTYFNPEKKGELVLLSGEVLISKLKTPFQLAIEVPLKVQPVEGRNDFVYTEDLKVYLTEVFRKTITPRLGKDNKKCLEWFVHNNINQNPFYQFEQFANKEEITSFYQLLYPKKDLKEQTRIINLPRGDVEDLNSVVNSDLFLKNRKHKPSYLLSIEEYHQSSENENLKKVKETSFNIKKAMTKHETGLTFPDYYLMKKSKKIIPIYLSSINYQSPFYFNSENNLLLINISHKSFSMEDEAKKDFYISQMLKVAANG